MKTKILISVLGVLLSLYGCKKEISEEINDHNVATDGTIAVSSRLTNGGWIFTSDTLKYDNGDIDSGLADNCKTDDLIKYENNGDATVAHGTIPCSIDPSNGKYADWELIDNGTRLKETFTRDIFGETTGTTIIYKVDFINNSKLVISRIITEPGKFYTQISTYTR